MSQIDVSVVMATYNHAPYVEEAIRSVLRQKGVTLEFLIADDGSQDDTPAAVRRISDPRIQFEAHSVNRGACVTTNELICKARGRYIALINSDDRWIGDDKLVKQVRLLEENPNIGASFGRARFIDQNGQMLPKKSPHAGGDIFDKENRSRGAWLRHFFDIGNCLLHPSVLIRKKCYEELGLYDNRYRQLPDFDMWIRLVKRYDIHISEENYVDFRILPGENASSQTASNAIRTINEHYLIARHFFDGIQERELHEGFGDQCASSLPHPECVEVESALLLLGEKGTYSAGLDNPYKVAALEKFFSLLGNERARKIMADHYAIDDIWFQRRMSEISVLRFRAATEATAAASSRRKKRFWKKWLGRS